MNSLKKIADTELGSNKKKIITTFFYNQNSTIAELAKELNLSIPTVTKLVNEMVEEGILNDYGKSDSKSGRKPSTYGLNPQSGYFLGIDIKRDVVNIGLSNFNGEIVRQDFDVTYNMQQSQDAIIDDICRLTLDFIASSGVDKNKILNACANITGRVNPTSGYSYSFFVYPETPLTEVLSEKLGVPVCIENDTRAMAYGEMLRGNVNGEKNMLFVNVSWGLGLGIILDGRVYEGKSGFAGEFGHIHAFDNEIMCHCGKKGCLETEVSGSALHRRVIESIREGKVSVLSQQFENLDDITLRAVRVLREVDLDREEPLRSEDAERLPLRCGIDVEHLTFRFADADRDTLHDVSFTVRKGERVGIRGASGSGKTTLFNLLLGFYAPTAGRIAIDGVPLTDENRRRWQNTVGYVSQNVFIADGTLLENVALGLPAAEIDRARADRAFASARMKEFIDTLPLGMDTPIGECGCRLSGGQRQRIGIARALYKQADVLLFDEATSSLDSRTEEEVNRSIEALSAENRELTIIVIAHRDSSLEYCDRIITTEE